MDKEKAKQIAYNLRGCAFDIMATYHWGFSEAVYEAAMELLMNDRGHKVDRQFPIQCYYKGRPTRQTYRMDLVIDDDFIVELKAVSSLLPEHRGQLINYSHLVMKPDCMLINFGPTGVQSEWYYVHTDSSQIDLL